MIHGKSLEAWCASHPLIRDLVALRETSWFNPGIAPAATALADVGLGADDVADASARYDREIKLPLYARHGVGEVWIVDLQARLLRICRVPTGDSYAEVSNSATPGRTPITALPGVEIELSAIFG